MPPSTREQITGMYDDLDLVQSVTKEVIAAFPDDKLDWSPAPGARTPRQIVEHIYASSEAHTAAVLRGTLTEAEHHRHEDAPKAGGTRDLLAWCDRKWAAIGRDARAATAEQLARPVKAFYGEFPGAQMLAFNRDEHWHHRGQLTVYLRLLGIPVPFLYDYAP